MDYLATKVSTAPKSIGDGSDLKWEGPRGYLSDALSGELIARLSSASLGIGLLSQESKL